MCIRDSVVGGSVQLSVLSFKLGVKKALSNHTEFLSVPRSLRREPRRARLFGRDDTFKKEPIGRSAFLERRSGRARHELDEIRKVGKAAAPRGSGQAGLPHSRLLGFGFFDEGFLADDYDDAGGGDVKAAAVVFDVVADLRVFGEADVAVNDGAADTRVTADVYVIVDDGVADFGIAVDADIVADDAVLSAATGEDGAARNNGIDGGSHTIRIGEDEFGRGIVLLPGAQGPVLVIKVEDGRDADEVHVGFVIGIDGANVSPVEGFFIVLIDKVVGEDAILRNDARKNVFTEIMGRLWIFGIGKKHGDEELRAEDIHAHGGVAVCGFVRRGFGLGGLFFKPDDAPVPVGFDDAKLFGSFFRGNFEGSDGDVGAGINVLAKHFGVIHFVDVVTRKNEDIFGTLAADGVNILINGVGGALIPLLRDAHLGRKDFDKFAEPHEGRPACTGVTAQAKRFVLRENENAAESGINAIGKSDVDDAIESAEGNGGLGAIASERPEAFALTASKEYRDGLAHIRHEEDSRSSFKKQLSVTGVARGRHVPRRRQGT